MSLRHDDVRCRTPSSLALEVIDESLEHSFAELKGIDGRVGGDLAIAWGMPLPSCGAATPSMDSSTSLAQCFQDVLRVR